MTVPVSTEQVLSYVAQERVRTSVRRRRPAARLRGDLSE